MTTVRTNAARKAKRFRRLWDIALVEGAKLNKDYSNISSAEFRQRLKNVIDDIFELPPVAEEISDIVIAIIVDAVAWRIRETDSEYVLVRRAEILKN